MREKLIIGTRKSPLALWQSNFIREQLEAAFPGIVIELLHIVTTGDRTQESLAAIPEIGGKGLFTAELEENLAAREIDLAVHSLKDLPTTLPEGFVIGAIPARAPVNDVFVSRTGCSFAELPKASVIGTSSVRRSSQILRLRPDLKTVLIRGNVDTRIRKVRSPNGEYDGTLLAQAGVQRLGLEDEVTEVLSTEVMLPAPGQGALGIECRSDDAELLSALQVLHDARAMAEVTAERAFLQALGAGCNTPVAALARVLGEGNTARLSFRGRCLTPDASRVLEVRGEGPIHEALSLGRSMADQVMAKGFTELAV
jgi:hydroxymethylbilane synthase